MVHIDTKFGNAQLSVHFRLIRFDHPDMQMLYDTRDSGVFWALANSWFMLRFSRSGLATDKWHIGNPAITASNCNRYAYVQILSSQSQRFLRTSTCGRSLRGINSYKFLDIQDQEPSGLECIGVPSAQIHCMRFLIFFIGIQWTTEHGHSLICVPAGIHFNHGRCFDDTDDDFLVLDHL